MAHSLGLSMHVGKVHQLMSRANNANCEDGLSRFCTKSQSLESLYKEVDEEQCHARNYGRVLCNAMPKPVAGVWMIF